MHEYVSVGLYFLFMLGIVANFSLGEANASDLGDGVFLEQEVSNIMESSSDGKPHRGSGR